ncbi:MAG: hypothetical protein CL862_12515 [Cyanobium sp. NAT70]|nr:hypothetical protein [Cyanobium sp. NAT70]MAR08859.1 hypothetical protein [Blastopirellula sp.]
MPPDRGGPRVGHWQRWRTYALLVLAVLVWLLRWLWPFQLLPGWALALLFAWAGLEVIRLIWFPHRWR